MDIKETIIKCLKEFDCKYIYLFGSFVSGDIRKESDIDIAFLSMSKLNAFKVFQKAQEISALIGREVDLIDLKESSTVFQNQVLTNGVAIFESSLIERELFEIHIIKKYMALNELRKELIAHYERDLETFLK